MKYAAFVRVKHVGHAKPTYNRIYILVFYMKKKLSYKLKIEMEKIFMLRLNNFDVEGIYSTERPMYSKIRLNCIKVNVKLSLCLTN
jgi:hypothetical protein